MTKCEWVSEKLKTQILAGIYGPGDKLPSETQLCAEFGVSRLSVRGAISMLAAQGLVETMKGKGSFVLDQKIQPVFPSGPISRIDLFEFRRILETESAGIAAQRASEEVIQILKDVTMKMHQTTDASEIAQYDELFHMHLAYGTQNSVIIQIFDLMKGMFRIMFEQNVGVLGSDGYLGHMRIIAAIETRNCEQAKEYMYEHLNSTMEKTSMINYELISGIERQK